MAQQPRHRDHIDALGEQQARSAVSQIVETDFAQARVPERRIQPAVQYVRRVVRLPGRTRKYQIMVALRAGEPATPLAH